MVCFKMFSRQKSKISKGKYGNTKKKGCYFRTTGIVESINKSDFSTANLPVLKVRVTFVSRK